MGRRISSALCACAVLMAACNSGGDDDEFGIPSRTTVEGLTFPTGLPQPLPLNTVPAFPSLRFNLPVLLTYPPDGTDRLFVVQLAGEIHVFDNDPAASTSDVFLDISGQVETGGEQGLLGLAFHPDYDQDGFFYVNYTAPSPRRTIISRWQVSADPNVADPDSETILLHYDQPFSNHNGGMLAFGPDGMLYISSGDGGSGGDPSHNGQSLNTLLGKILRIDPDGGIPPDNPFVGVPGARGEIWAYGLRNPWRFSFDRDTGTLWCGDVGQGDREEIDIIERGDNLGWRYFEGNREFNNPYDLPASDFVAPVIDYPHSLGRSVTGGYVYRGAALPSLYGVYFYADYASHRVWALVYEDGQVISNTEVASVQGPASFGEDEQGELYVCSLGPGTIYRFEEPPGGGGPPPFPQVLSETGIFADLATLEASPGIIEYDVNSPLWSDGAWKRRWLALPGLARIEFFATGAWDFPVGTVLVKHFEIDVTGGSTRRLETRVLLRHASGWEGYTYRWNPAATDADLLDAAETDTFVVDDPAAPGGQRTQTWYFPSRTDCFVCHTSAAGSILGVRTLQINRDFDYPALTDNQLRAWNHIRLFDVHIGDHAMYGALVDPADVMAAVDARARSYLAVNCANCHLPGGPTPVDIDLRIDVTAAAMNVIGVPSTNDPRLFRVDPGSKETSVLWDLMGRLDAQRMPPLGSSVADGVGLEAVGAWIDAGAP